MENNIGSILHHFYAFSVLYNQTNCSPMWVLEYVIYRNKFKRFTGSGKRKSYFYSGIGIPHELPKTLYNRYGLQRGHLAAVMNQYGSKFLEHETNNFVNITPQYKKFNCGIWLKLEHIVINNLLPFYGKIFIISGPIINKTCIKIYDSKSRKIFYIPSHYYKVLLYKNPSDNYHIINTFIFPHNNLTATMSSDINAYMCCLETLEFFIGFKFFPNINRQSVIQRNLII